MLRMVALLALVASVVRDALGQGGTVQLTPDQVRNMAGKPEDSFGGVDNPKRAALVRGYKTIKVIIECMDEAGAYSIADELSVRNFHLAFKIAEGEIVELPGDQGGAVTFPTSANTAAQEATVESDPEFGGSDSHRTIGLFDGNWTTTTAGEQGYTAGVGSANGITSSMLKDPAVSDVLMGLVLNHEVGHCLHDGVGSQQGVDSNASLCAQAKNELENLKLDTALMEKLILHPDCISNSLLPAFYKGWLKELNDYKKQMEKQRDANC